MAFFNIEFYSNCLNRSTTLKMVVPTDWNNTTPSRDDNPYFKRPMKTLFLLHGYTGKGDCWVPEFLAEKYNFAIVCPNGENSFWLDGISTGHKFQTFVGEELISFVRKTFGLATKREDTYIMGFSMGGFGALHTALAYPDVFSKTAPLSSAFIHNEVMEMKPGSSNPVANYEYYRECFGEPSELKESENNPEVLIKKLKEQGKEFPEIFMAVGTEDFLLEPNRAMHKFLEDSGIKHTYLEWKGNHDFDFWNECVKKFVPLMME